MSRLNLKGKPIDRGPDPINPTVRVPPYKYRMWRGRTMLSRIEDRCTKSDIGCWLYPSRRADYSYAYIDVTADDGTRQQWMAHRYTYALARGEIPPGHQVCHKCDVRNCVNPAHLWAGTHYQNVVDRERKAKLPLGADKLALPYPPVTANDSRGKHG